jgi:predicted amidohydrolase
MKDLKVSAVQFENKSGDKSYNLGVIERFTADAAASGSQVIAFHECSITGYSFARNLSKAELLSVAEFVPDGDSINRLIQIARQYRIVVLAGLFEKDAEENVYNTYVCVDEKG